MTMQSLVKGIQQLLKRKLNIYPVALSDKTELQKDLDMAEWEKAYLLNAVEQNWHIHISDNEAADIVNMGQLMAIVRKQSLPHLKK
jgi:acyl carrier protein